MAKDFQTRVKNAKDKIKAAQTTVSKTAATASLENITKEAAAQAKNRRDYASVLSDSLKAYNAVLDRYATKVARGDKLDPIEQQELEDAINKASEVNDAINKALKDAADIEAQGRRDYATAGAKQRAATTTSPTGAGPTGAPVDLTGGVSASTKAQSDIQAKTKADAAAKKQSDAAAKAKADAEAKAKAAEEAAVVDTTTPTGMGAVGRGEYGPTISAPTDLQTLLKKSDFWYDMPDYIFQTIPELGDILVKAAAENWSNEKFLSAAKLTKWWQSNSATFRQRTIDKAKYNELRSQGVDVSKSDYGQYLSKQISAVKARAKQIAGVTLDDAQAQQVAEKIYDGYLDGDQLAIDRLITPFIGKVVDRYAGKDVSTYGGEALRNYQMLQAIAKANGLQLKDIMPQISTATTGGDLEKAVLQGLATGDLDVQRLAQNARMVAAQGQPEYVRNLLNQGYDLEQIYSPYKTVMSNVLELNPDQIDLNDPTLRSAINNNGDMNIYDFKKALRQDSRWQYTSNAHQDVSNAVLGVLRDFGFQG